MISVAPSVIALLFVALLNCPTLCESLKCYECSGNESCGQGETDRVVACAGMCMSYLNGDRNGTVVRRCCTDDCVTESDRKAYFCMKDKCNGIHSDRKLSAVKNKIGKKRISLKTTSEGNGSSLSCYDCSAHNPECAVGTATLVQGCQTCMVYRNVNDNNNVIRRCCTSGCGSPDTIGEFDGRKTYFCSSNQCNGIGAEEILANETNSDSVSTMSTTLSSTEMIPSTTTTMTTTKQTSFSCYECSGLNDQACTTTALNCPMCMVYPNADDPNKFDRRCCWWACGAPNQISEYASRPTYFCDADHCNGLGSETIFGQPTTTTSSTSTVVSTSTALTTTVTTVNTEQSISQCYECSGPDCGREGSSVSTGCSKCMVYRNPDDQTKIERRCCWWACGPSNSIGTHNGVETYFCAGDKCNGHGAEYALSPAVTTTTATAVTATATMMVTITATTAITTTTAATIEQSSSQCYECSGPDCGKEGSSMASNCPKCMVYRNPNDQTNIERHCCWWACGPSNSIGTHNGVETYFCAGDKCNGHGAEYALSPAVTTTAVTTITTMMVTITATTTITTTTAATIEQSSSQCYECSGPDCGKEGSSMASNCPKCMVYRNPNDQTNIERHCCWWGCGPSNSIGTYNGVETYFCAGDKCNGHGAEYALSPSVMTTTATMMTSSSAINSTTSSAGSCVLNCRNGGTPETEDGCFCYCLENTSGRECENVDCAQQDVDTETCSLENQPLCEESETFAFECLHLCGKC